VRFADVLVDAIDATLKDRKVSLDGVRVDIAAHILVLRVVDSLMSAPNPEGETKHCRDWMFVECRTLRQEESTWRKRRLGSY
jgi:hypothetical protein